MNIAILPDDKCMTKASLFQFWIPIWYGNDIPIRCADTEIHTFVFKAGNSSNLASEKSATCVWMGEGGGGQAYMYVKDIMFRK